jgi:hypothetical protein
MTEYTSEINDKRIVVSGGYLGTMMEVPLLRIQGPVHVFNVKLKRKLPDQYRDIYRYILYVGSHEEYREKKKTLDSFDLQNVFNQFLYSSFLGNRSYGSFCDELQLGDNEHTNELWGCFRRICEKAKDLGISDDDISISLPNIKPHIKMPHIFIKGGW